MDSAAGGDRRSTSPVPNLRTRGPKLRGGWDSPLSLAINALTGCGPNLGVPNGRPSILVYRKMVPTFSVLLHECKANGRDQGVRLGTSLFLNGFSCPQPRSEVGTALGPPRGLGRTCRLYPLRAEIQVRPSRLIGSLRGEVTSLDHRRPEEHHKVE
jgi:hypothetical protein